MERQYAYGLGIDDVLVFFDRDGETYDVYYYLKDPLWTVEALVDENASIVEAYAYEVYGKPTIKTGAGNDGTWFTADDTTATASAKGNPYMFTSRRWNHDINLQHNRARWYDPTPGRWLSRDPAGYVDGLNLYEYVRSGPQVSADVTGLQCSKNTCDRWHFTPEAMWTGTYTVGVAGVKARLRADEGCCMDDYSRLYFYIGIAAGAGLKGTIHFSDEGKWFSTDCIGWDAHQGFGVVGSAGIGFGKLGFGLMQMGLPQALLHFWGWGRGIDASLFVSDGFWFVESP